MPLLRSIMNLEIFGKIKSLLISKFSSIIFIIEDPTTTPSQKEHTFFTCSVFFIPKPATTGKDVNFLTSLIDWLSFSILAECWPVIPVIVT